MKSFLYLLITLNLSAFAQESEKTYKMSKMFWVGHFSSITLSNKFNLNNDIQFRTKDYFIPNQTVVRSGLHYKPDRKFSVLAGLAYFQYYSNNQITKNEIRPWQEIQIIDSLYNKQLVHRFRVEERFQCNTVIKDTKMESTFNFRFRYKAEYKVPIGVYRKIKFCVTISNEVMLNSGKNIKYNYFDQNRLSTGLLINLTKTTAFHLQYIYLTSQQNDGLTFLRTNVFRLNVIQKF